MVARVSLVDQLRGVGTRDAITEAIEHCKALIQLDRWDDLDVRTILPDLPLQLAEDQYCYDIIKWYQTVPDEYDWHDSSSPYLNIQGADPYEGVDVFNDEYTDFSHIISLLLIKLKLLVDVRSIRFARRVLSIKPLPTELVDKILLYSMSSPISEKLVRIPSASSLCRLESELIVQCQKLGGLSCAANSYFWPNFWTAIDYEGKFPSESDRGTYEEALIVFKNCLINFWSADGVLRLLQLSQGVCTQESISLGQQNSSNAELEVLMAQNPAFETGGNPRAMMRTRTMWLFFDDALKELDSRFWRTMWLLSDLQPDLD